MSRTRAERRHNTHVKTSRRKALAIRGEIDQFVPGGICGGKISLNGEACSCSLCESCKPIDRDLCNWADVQANEWTRANLDDYAY